MFLCKIYSQAVIHTVVWIYVVISRLKATHQRYNILWDFCLHIISRHIAGRTRGLSADAFKKLQKNNMAGLTAKIAFSMCFLSYLRH